MKDLKEQPKIVFDTVSEKIGDPSFAKDYKGLYPGDIVINTDMFINNRLEGIIDKVNKFYRVLFMNFSVVYFYNSVFGNYFL